MNNQIYYCKDDDGNHYWTANERAYNGTKAAWPEYKARPMLRHESRDALHTYDEFGNTYELSGLTIQRDYVLARDEWVPFVPMASPIEVRESVTGVTLEELLADEA